VSLSLQSHGVNLLGTVIVIVKNRAVYSGNLQLHQISPDSSRAESNYADILYNKGGIRNKNYIEFLKSEFWIQSNLLGSPPLKFLEQFST